MWESTPDVGIVSIREQINGVLTGVTHSATRILQSASPGDRYTLRAQIDVPASFAEDFLFWYQTTSSGMTLEAQDIVLQVEVIKK